VRSCASTGSGFWLTDGGYEAIRVLVDHQVDLLFRDIAMPGISRVQLARQAKLIQRSSRPLHNGRRRASVRQGHPLRQVLQKVCPSRRNPGRGHPDSSGLTRPSSMHHCRHLPLDGLTNGYPK
jgi:hypothetical protein